MSHLTSPSLWFSLGGIPSDTPGWRTRNKLDLVKPALVRTAEPTVIPGASGTIPHTLYNEGTERVLTGKVFGQYDQNGDRHPSEIQGLTTNLTVLSAAWRTIPGSTGSVLPLVLHLPDGTSKSADVQVRDFDWDDGDMPVVANFILRLYIPTGALA